MSVDKGNLFSEEDRVLLIMLFASLAGALVKARHAKDPESKGEQDFLEIFDSLMEEPPTPEKDDLGDPIKT